MKQKKAQINSVDWQHTSVDNNKTNEAQASQHLIPSLQRNKTKEISMKNIGVKVLITKRIISLGRGRSKVKLENLWNKKTQINSVGWQRTRVDT